MGIEAVGYNAAVRIALTLGTDASRSEKNDYIRALLAAGFRREEIVVLSPGSKPEGQFDGLVLAGGLDVDPSRWMRIGTLRISRSSRRLAASPFPHSGSAGGSR